MKAAEFHAGRSFVDTPSGRIAFVAYGDGPAALFVHGVFLNGFLWRDVIEEVRDVRRCIAIDLLAHGHTQTSSTQDMSFTAQAKMIVEFLDALGIERVDLVGNDSGGAIAQLVAAHHPDRLRTLTLTNCDVHDNWPPEAFRPTLAAAAAGGLRAGLEAMLADIDFARSELGLGVGYAQPLALSPETVAAYLAPLVACDQAVGNLERFLAAMDSSQTVSIYGRLKTLRVPTLVMWGTDDVFFDVRWAHWLCETIPGAEPAIEVHGGKLFFPEEEPQLVGRALRTHWTRDRGPSEHANQGVEP